MIVQAGYDNKPTHIRIYASSPSSERVANLWIEQEGLVEKNKVFVASAKNGRVKNTATETYVGHSGTLAYMTLDELLALRDECNQVIQELVA